MQRISHTLGEEHQEVHYETLELLAGKLKIAIGNMNSVMKSKGSGDDGVHIQRWKYALLQQKIDKAIEDLALWQQMFDPSWFMVMKAATPQIDAELKSFQRASTTGSHTPISSAQSLRSALDPAKANNISIFLPEVGLESLELRDIPLCSAKIGLREDPSKGLILQHVQASPGVQVAQLERDIRDLARKLAHSVPLEFGLLNCKGVIKHHKNSNPPIIDSFTFVFRIPPGLSNPRSLRRCLQELKQTESLTDRFRLASELARSVSYIHMFGFVHKNIRPETILLLSGESSVGSAFLIGFDCFRTAEGKTSRRGDSAWEKSLYQHPRRIGANPADDYIMQHDIYSLGMCLLEIGLWKSFVAYDTDSCIPNDGSDTHAIRTPVLGNDLSTPSFKDHLLSLARGELRSRMGSKYSEIVETCLTCLDPGNADFGDEEEFRDEDGIQVGVRYIEKVSV